MIFQMKPLLSLHEIKNLIQTRISEDDSMDGDCKSCQAPTPRYVYPSVNDGCNWTIDVLPGLVPGCSDFVMNIVRSVMKEVDLKP